MEEQKKSDQQPTHSGSAPDKSAQSAPQGSNMTKIHVDRELCIGASSCVAIAPGVFQLDSEGKAYVVAADGADEESIRLAAESCPVKAILLHDKDDKQIFP